MSYSFQTSHPSANVYVKEIDMSLRVVGVASNIGVVVGASAKGPINKPTLITNTQEFIDIFGKPNPQIGFMHYSALVFLEQSARLYVTRVAKNALTAGAFVTVDDPTDPNPIINMDSFNDALGNPVGINDPINTLGFDPTDPAIENILFYITAIDPGDWNNQIYVQIRPSNPSGFAVGQYHDTTEFYIDVFVNYTGPTDNAIESFKVTRYHKIDGFGNQLFLEDVINNVSQYIYVKNNNYSNLNLPITDTAFNFFTGGTNGDPVTEYDVAAAWEAYNDTENFDINLLINAGYSNPVVQRKMDEICHTRMDCVALLDVPSNMQKVADAVNYRRNILNMESSYSALYLPDVRYYDRYNDFFVFIPLSGFAAAACANTDEQAALWFAPAGLNRGAVRVTQIKHIYNLAARDALNDAQLNMVRFFPSAGYAIWNQSTCYSKPSSLQNLNVRRLMNYMEISISKAVMYGLFEPNDDILRAQLVDICVQFLKPLVAGRAVYEYDVICDRTNNFPNTIANGDVILDVIVDPVLPAKRILLRAIINKKGAKFRDYQ